METRRPLTDKEINNIIDFIQPIPTIPIDIAEASVKNHKYNYIKQLKSITIYPSKIPELKKILEKQFFAAQIQPGKSVGPLAATSAGEKTTQQSLSSFHQAGQLKITLTTGVPRLEEILSVARDIKTPSCDVYFDLPVEDLKDILKVKLTAQRILEYQELVDFLIDYDFCSDRQITNTELIWYDFYKTFYNGSFVECSWSVRLKFNINKIYEYRKELAEFATIIETEYADAYCVISPDNIGIIDVYIQTENIGYIDDIVETLKISRKKKKKKDEDTPDDDILDDDTDLRMLITEENKEYYFLRDLVIPSIIYSQVGGIKGITKCYYEESKNGQWMIKTNGSNLKTIIQRPEVISISGSSQWGDLCTTSNHLWDIYEVFGVEATKIWLRKEFEKLINIDSRHLDLLVSSMTFSGKPVPASRYGIDANVMAQASFEQSVDNFFKASIKTTIEDNKSISFCIVMGKLAPTGTGMVTTVDLEGNEIDVDKMVYDFTQNMNLLVAMNSGKQSIHTNISTHSPALKNQPDMPSDQPVIRKPVLGSKHKKLYTPMDGFGCDY